LGPLDGVKVPSTEFPFALKARTLATTVKGKHHVQSMRTVAVYRYKKVSIFPENRAPAAAPNGLFEIRAAWERAITAASDYIYMEDQSYWSAEVLSWVNTAVQANPDLRVILMASGGADPNDPVMPDQEILTLSIDQSLLAGLSATQRDQGRMFQALQRRGDGRQNARRHRQRRRHQRRRARPRTERGPERGLPGGLGVSPLHRCRRVLDQSQPGHLGRRRHRSDRRAPDERRRPGRASRLEP
jgi:hypothetical protein